MSIRTITIIKNINRLMEAKAVLHGACWRKIIGMVLAVLLTSPLKAETIMAPADTIINDSIVHDTFKGTAYVTFPLNKTDIRPDFKNNRHELGRISDMLDILHTDTTVTLQKIIINGYASPDGPYNNNQRLSIARTDSLSCYVSRIADIPLWMIQTQTFAEDWDGVESFVSNASVDILPDRENILALVRDTTIAPDTKEHYLKTRYPKDYQYLLKNCMPSLRRSEYAIDYMRTTHIPMRTIITAVPKDTVHDTIFVYVMRPRKIVKTALRTNLLYDAFLLPTIGLEVYLGNKWSIGGDWTYTWFFSNRKNRFWQSYGGYVYVRKYFGKKADERPFLGHHLGVYGLGLTYDVEFGGRGYQAAKYGFGGGVEYGYSKRIGKRLSLDFSIGLGFQGGEYKEYLPKEGHYVWQVTKHRHWWGPTRAEIALKWNMWKWKGGDK